MPQTLLVEGPKYVAIRKELPELYFWSGGSNSYPFLFNFCKIEMSLEVEFTKVRGFQIEAERQNGLSHHPHLLNPNLLKHKVAFVSSSLAEHNFVLTKSKGMRCDLEVEP